MHNYLYQTLPQPTRTFQNNKSTLNPQQNKQQILSTLHKGFNNFYQINFPKTQTKKSRLLIRSKRFKTFTQQSFYSRQKSQSTHSTYSKNQTVNKNNYNTNNSLLQPSFNQSCPILAQSLRQNKFKLERVKTQVQQLRRTQFNDYIKKSLRYQQLLNLNQNKKKHLPTLNTKIGQVVKKSLLETQSKNITYEIKYQKIPLEGWKPESREGHTCIIYKNNAIIIGGHCSQPFSTVQVYSFDKNLWIKQIATPTARSYHSSLLYKNRFIITFGGMGVYDISRKCRNCYNSVSLIDLHNFSYRQIKMHNQETVQARRSHASALMAKNMIVFGGMNSKKQFLNDFVYLDLKELRWYHKEIKIEGKQLNELMETGIAKHKAITLFKQRKHISFYQADYLEYEGIYVFGGGFGSGQQNIVLQFSFNKYIPILKKLDYLGIPPSSIDPILQRFNNDMILIISGDQKQRQIRLFKPLVRQFTIINDSSSKLLGGIGSSITEYQNKYYVFFGLGEDGYIGNISSFEIQEKIKQKENKKKKIYKFNNGEIADWKENNWEVESGFEEGL